MLRDNVHLSTGGGGWWSLLVDMVDGSCGSISISIQLQPKKNNSKFNAIIFQNSDKRQNPPWVILSMTISAVYILSFSDLFLLGPVTRLNTIILFVNFDTKCYIIMAQCYRYFNAKMISGAILKWRIAWNIKEPWWTHLLDGFLSHDTEEKCQKDHVVTTSIPSR